MRSECCRRDSRTEPHAFQSIQENPWRHRTFGTSADPSESAGQANYLRYTANESPTDLPTLTSNTAIPSPFLPFFLCPPPPRGFTITTSHIAVAVGVGDQLERQPAAYTKPILQAHTDSEFNGSTTSNHQHRPAHSPSSTEHHCSLLAYPHTLSTTNCLIYPSAQRLSVLVRRAPLCRLLFPTYLPISTPMVFTISDKSFWPSDLGLCEEPEKAAACLVLPHLTFRWRARQLEILH